MINTIPIDTANPTNNFKKSFPIIGNTFLISFVLCIVDRANSLPANSPTNTQVVDMGILLMPAKYHNTEAYTKSIIVADLI